MTLTIHLNDDLIAQLRKKALSKQLPAEELAAKLLGNAIAQLDQTERKSTQNQRRLALIRKSTSATLSRAEQAELDSLQSALDRQLDAVDEQLLGTLHDMQQAVKVMSPS